MKFLKQLMEQKHMTVSELSRQSLVSDSALRDILSGKTQIDRCEALTLVCVATALDTTVEDILYHYYDEMDEADAQPAVCELDEDDVRAAMDNASDLLAINMDIADCMEALLDMIKALLQECLRKR